MFGLAVRRAARSRQEVEKKRRADSQAIALIVLARLRLLRELRARVGLWRARVFVLRIGNSGRRAEFATRIVL